MSPPTKADTKRSASWFKKFQYDEDKDKPGEARNVLLVVVALIAAVTFQAGVNPPGGVWQEGDHAGRAIYSSQKFAFYVFLISNTLALSSCILVITSLTYRFPFHFEIWVATASMMITYASAVFAVTPHEIVRFRYLLIAASVPFLMRCLGYFFKKYSLDYFVKKHCLGYFIKKYRVVESKSQPSTGCPFRSQSILTLFSLSLFPPIVPPSPDLPPRSPFLYISALLSALGGGPTPFSFFSKTPLQQPPRYRLIIQPPRPQICTLPVGSVLRPHGRIGVSSFDRKKMAGAFTDERAWHNLCSSAAQQNRGSQCSPGKTMARMLGNNESLFESAGKTVRVVDAKVRNVTYRPRILIMNPLSVLTRYCKTTVIDLQSLVEAPRISFA
ncbi:hypothetical protein OIU79_019155 [Salix purpurea]|uniref:PGG domain-containing protein n=1 Tax=Salix purpurea TaxID=77065 RepID=A0A9Q0SJI5_SALPP|nr:hypothetical protein OIU79_019155 [Salix purpurea]